MAFAATSLGAAAHRRWGYADHSGLRNVCHHRQFANGALAA
jgi:hypothetical protein